MNTDILVPKNARTLVVATNLIIMVLAMVGVLFKWFALGPSEPPLPGLVVVLLTVGNSVYLSRNGSTDVAAWAIIGLLIFGLTVAGFNSGGLGGPIALLAPLVPIFAVLLISARAGLITMLVVVVILIGLFALHMSGSVPDNPNSEVGVLVGRFLAVVFSAFAATWVVWGFAETVRDLLRNNEELANTDHLTNIANRRYVETRLESEASRSKRSDSWLSFIICDVDNFKKYNDINGHPQGDRCLIEVAAAMRESVRRPADLVGRYGGEEFVVLLPETEPAGATQIAEIIRLAILDRQLPYEAGKPELVSLTLGVVSCQGHLLDDVEKLVKAADDALYQGKEQGRNRVISVVLDNPDVPASNKPDELSTRA